MLRRFRLVIGVFVVGRSTVALLGTRLLDEARVAREQAASDRARGADPGDQPR
jgi:hypothetical protein